jgi:hypothetical protein
MTAPFRTQIEQLQRAPFVIGSLSQENRTFPQWQLARYVVIDKDYRVNPPARGRRSAGVGLARATAG